MKSKKLMKKNDAIKFKQFQKQNHHNQQKNDLSKKSQRFQNSFSDYDSDRDRNCDHDKSQFYHKNNHQNSATSPNSNAI